MDRHAQLNICRDFLTRHEIGVMATSSPDGRTHASVVNYFTTHPSEIYFIARENAQKFRNLILNPWTSLVIIDEGLSSSLEVNGNSEKLEDSPRVTDLLMRFAKMLRMKNSGPLPILRHPGSELYLFRLKPETLAYADFRPSHERDGEYFELTLV